MLQNAEELVTMSRLTYGESLTPQNNSGIRQRSLNIWTLTVESLSKGACHGRALRKEKATAQRRWPLLSETPSRRF